MYKRQRLGCGMLFGFCGNRLHVAVPNGGDAFEPSLLSQPKPNNIPQPSRAFSARSRSISGGVRI